MIRPFLAGAVLLLAAACASTPVALLPQQEAAEAATITALLQAQDASWNAGDIEGFMNGYWPSGELRFASGGNVVRGYEATLARYKLRYPGREGMGALSTSDHEIDLLSEDAAIAHGSWKVTTAESSSGGLYTLVLRKMDGRWLIISDTTTLAE